VSELVFLAAQILTELASQMAGRGVEGWGCAMGWMFLVRQQSASYREVRFFQKGDNLQSLVGFREFLRARRPLRLL
jgi:hypothetical protein